MDSDSLIVGAGSAGLLAAKEIASKGFSVKILEEHSQVGIPSHCAGLVSIEGLKRIGVVASKSFVQNDVVGGWIYSPDGHSIEIRDKRPRAHVIDRIALDQYLAESAIDAGAELVLGRRAEKLKLINGSIVGVIGTEWAEESRLIIDAEGPSRRLVKEAGLVNSRRVPLLGVNTEVKCDMDPTMVEVWFGEETAPGFFAWVIPTSNQEARVGLATRVGDPIMLLTRFIKRRFGAVSYQSPRIGQVLVDGPVSRTSFPGMLLVGDAAGQVKPTTGGGIVLGGLCAIKAGSVASQSLESGDLSERSLVHYEDEWRRLYGAEFRSMQTLRNLVDRISDERMNRLLRIFNESGLNNVLEEIVAGGDMDLQEGVIKRALSEPKFMRVMVSGLGRLAFAELRNLVNI
jgi:geranylgeranyl reductase family protein